MSEQKDNTVKSRKVEIPGQEGLLSNLSRVHKAGDLSPGVAPEDGQSEKQIGEPIEEQSTNANEENSSIDENQSPNQHQKRKKTFRSDDSGYKSLFLKRNEADNRKNVYINQNLHKTVSDIVSAVKIIDNKTVTVGGYIDNVLTEHFETHKDEINSLYRIGKNDLVK